MTTNEKRTLPDLGGFGSAVRRMTAANAVGLACAAVTATLLARVLGPGGRGQVSAVFAVVGIAPFISEMGLTTFLTRERARGVTSKGALVGSIVPLALLWACVTAAFAIPIAHLIGQNRAQVVRFTEVGLYMLPASVFFGCMSALASAEQRWRLVSATQVLSAVGTATTLVALAACRALTVGSACVAYLAVGLLATLPLLVVLLKVPRHSVSIKLMKTAMGFGVRSWVATLASVGNAQFDQVLLAAIVPSRELGWYALASTIGSLAGAFVTPMVNVLLTRISAGSRDLLPPASRRAIAIMAMLAVPVGASAPWTVPLVFGTQFRPAVPIVAVILAAGIIGAPCYVLGTSLTAAGRPGAAAVPQVITLLATIIGLLLVLPRYGALGAAWINLAANVILLAMTLPLAANEFRVSPSALLIPRRSDFHDVLAWLAAVTHRQRSTGRSPGS